MQTAHALMKVLSLFSIAGISSCKAQEPVNSVEHGSFSIQRIVQTEKGSGSVQNKKYNTRSYLIEYRVLYKGRKVKFPAPLQQGSSYNFPWRVYILKDAPSPTLLAGSQNMFLISEEAGKPKIIRLNQHDAKFGSIQWLDSNNGLPGDEKQILDLQKRRLARQLISSGGRKTFTDQPIYCVEYRNVGETSI
jgi:hypothetical protein